ncbi:hypothetical protein F1880_005189 [Penicillium rolfsii]|nr:hypothetical protein F1880_005189 [Penicillium rolfsii]
MSEVSSTTPLASRIASLVHAHFDGLPARSKPKIFPDGSREWIPMTGIVAVKDLQYNDLAIGENTHLESLHCISVTSGAKCLPASHIPRCQGLVLHDCHAEILAVRAFNYWLLTECHALLTMEGKTPINSDETLESGHIHASISPFLRKRQQALSETDESTPSVHWPPFEIQPDVKFYMYCTCAPCGDASMELCMAAQEDATPWDVTRHSGASSSDQSDLQEENLLDGRAHFSLLGVVRRKPARMDAESTRSKSCSDKLALRQVSSLLSCETSRLVAPTENAYLAGLVLPEDEISRVGFERSFGEKGRMRDLVGRSWPAGTEDDESATAYRFRPFEILSVPAEEVEALWPFSKPKAVQTLSALSRERQVDSTDSKGMPKKSKPGNVSSIWTAASSLPHPCVMTMDTGSKSLPNLGGSKTGLYETIINGVKQGNRLATPTARGASSLSRAKLWGLLRSIRRSKECLREFESQSSREDNDELYPVKDAGSYEDFKRSGGDVTDPLHIRQQAMHDAKKVLKGWVPNAGDAGWNLDVLVDSKKRKSENSKMEH